MNIIFMGTPEIAAHSLKRINESKNNVIAVITSPDKPAGRGRKIRKSDVKKYAQENGLKILQPQNLKNEDFISEIINLKPDLIVVLAFRMLPKVIWQIPKYGTVNLHASLLPNYRGAAPINWAIINGEKETGVTTFFIDEKIDTGNIISQNKITIEYEDNAETLHDKIMLKGADLLLKTIDLIKNKEVKTITQKSIINNKIEIKSAPKIFKDDCKINWNADSEDIYNFIRGMSPFPGAWSILKMENKRLTVKIFSSELITEKHNFKNGTILFDKKNFKIATKDGYIHILDIRPQGKKNMSGADFSRGYNLNNAFFE
ncbi:MAG: methionyl-tRNA formyltransferase [Bacteroidota bacterium]|nr:methionyl-tRNA formyltransferase [Bacteroidota bacterium]